MDLSADFSNEGTEPEEREREREREKHCSIWLASHCDILTGEACVLANLCSSQQEN